MTEVTTSVPEVPTRQQLDEMYESLKNWGLWGADDERGALNHQTPEHRVAAGRLVVDGVVVSLANNLALTPSAENPFPAHHHMLAAGDGARHNSGLPGYEGARDYIGADVHGLGVTHVDALCHMFVRGEMYNGVPASEVRSDGARRNTVMSLADGIVGRGVLLDIARLRGVPFLEGNSVVTLAELEAAEQAEGLRVGVGDILIVGTGRQDRRESEGGALRPADGMAGLHPECLPWLHERRIAALGSDGISDSMPGLGVDHWPFPVHQIGITAIGLHLMDNLALGGLARMCGDRSRWEFLFSVAPLRIQGGTGCPVNPVAVL